MSPRDETPLGSIGTIPDDVVQRLHGRWISSAEQLVAAAATPGGPESLAEQLGLSVEEISRLVAAARDALPPDTVAELESPADNGEFRLGAQPPRPQPDDDPQG